MNMCMRKILLRARQHTKNLFQIQCNTSVSLLEETETSAPEMFSQLFSAGGDQEPAASTTQQHTHLLLYPGWNTNAKCVVTYRIGQLSETHLAHNIPSIAPGTARCQPSGLYLKMTFHKTCNLNYSKLQRWNRGTAEQASS